MDEQPKEATPALYTAAEAAVILRVKASWLQRQAAVRKIPFTMLGRSYRFTPAHLAVIIQLYEHGPRLDNEHLARAGGRDRARGRAAVTTKEPRLLPRPRKRTPRGLSEPAA